MGPFDWWGRGKVNQGDDSRAERNSALCHYQLQNTIERITCGLAVKHNQVRINKHLWEDNQSRNHSKLAILLPTHLQRSCKNLLQFQKVISTDALRACTGKQVSRCGGGRSTAPTFTDQQVSRLSHILS